MDQELEGVALDEAVARAIGVEPGAEYSRSWHHAGPLIEREQISLIRQALEWCADMRGVECQFDERPLVAAMRALVKSRKPPTVRAKRATTAGRQARAG